MSEDKVVDDKKQTKSTNEIDYSKFSFVDAAKKKFQADSKTRLREAMRLKRVMITCNNPNKRQYEGDIFCARNKFIEGVKKFVPFGRETHVPLIIYNMIKEKKCQMFKEEHVNGHKVMKPYYINEYNVEDLPPISTEQYEAIKQHQLAEGKMGI